MTIDFIYNNQEIDSWTRCECIPHVGDYIMVLEALKKYRITSIVWINSEYIQMTVISADDSKDTNYNNKSVTTNKLF